MDLRINKVRSRKEKIFVSSSLETATSFITMMVELNVATGENKLIFINKRDYILVNGEYELGKDQFIDTLGEKLDNEIISKSIIYAMSNKYIDRVLKRINKG